MTVNFTKRTIFLLCFSTVLVFGISTIFVLQNNSTYQKKPARQSAVSPDPSSEKSDNLKLNDYIGKILGYSTFRNEKDFFNDAHKIEALAIFTEQPLFFSIDFFVSSTYCGQGVQDFKEDWGREDSKFNTLSAQYKKYPMLGCNYWKKVIGGEAGIPGFVNEVYNIRPAWVKVYARDKNWNDNRPHIFYLEIGDFSERFPAYYGPFFDNVSRLAQEAEIYKDSHKKLHSETQAAREKIMTQPDCFSRYWLAPADFVAWWQKVGEAARQLKIISPIISQLAPEVSNAELQFCTLPGSTFAAGVISREEPGDRHMFIVNEQGAAVNNKALRFSCYSGPVESLDSYERYGRYSQFNNVENGELLVDCGYGGACQFDDQYHFPLENITGGKGATKKETLDCGYRG